MSDTLQTPETTAPGLSEADALAPSETVAAFPVDASSARRVRTTHKAAGGATMLLLSVISWAGTTALLAAGINNQIQAGTGAAMTMNMRNMLIAAGAAAFIAVGLSLGTAIMAVTAGSKADMLRQHGHAMVAGIVALVLSVSAWITTGVGMGIYLYAWNHFGQTSQLATTGTFITTIAFAATVVMAIAAGIVAMRNGYKADTAQREALTV